MKGKGKKLFGKLGSSKDDVDVERKSTISVQVSNTNVLIGTPVIELRFLYTVHLMERLYIYGSPKSAYRDCMLK